MSLESAIIIYCDGACSGNPGPGGWGAIVSTPDGRITELGGGHPKTTNNQMELTAATEALQLVAKQKGPVVVYTDSVYVIRGITQWVWGWMRRGWKTAEGKDVLNQEHWQDLFEVVKGRKDISWKYVRGHTGNPGNERCDEIAVAFSQGQRLRLYDGPLGEYSVSIGDLPPEVEIPEMKGKPTGPKPQYMYLSLLGTIPMRHKTWAQCERRTKGQPGAKFKKFQTSQEEAEILKGWGISDPSRVTDDPS